MKMSSSFFISTRRNNHLLFKKIKLINFFLKHTINMYFKILYEHVHRDINVLVLPQRIFYFPKVEILINVLFTLLSVTRRDVINSMKFRKKIAASQYYDKNGSSLIMTNTLLNLLHYATILDEFSLFSFEENHVSSPRTIFAL